jgi:hypothetical protein
MAVVYGTQVEPSLLLLPAPTKPDADGGFARFKHGIPGAAAVDIYLNDVLVTPFLSFDAPASEYLALPEGEYTVSVRFGGESADLIADSVEVAIDDRFTLILLESEGGIELFRFDDPVSGITADESVINVINALSDESTLSVNVGDTEVLANVEAGESDSAILEPGTDPVTASITANEVTETFELIELVYGGIYYSILAIEGDGGSQAVLLDPVSLAQGISSAPGDETINITTVETEAAETVEPTEVAIAETTAEPLPETTVETTETAVPEVSEPIATPVPPTATGPTAVVQLDPGANLHVRQFPSSNAFSLGLAPSGAVLDVIGRQGAPELDPEETPEPEATAYVDPAALLASPDEDLNPADTWLFVTYHPAEGGEIDGWVNALYLTVSDQRGFPQRLADLPTVPSNRSGEVRQTTGQAPPTSTPIAADAVIATVQLNPGANLHLRRQPNENAESLALIPNGTQLVVTGQIESGDWLQVSYEGQQGWIASQYVTLTMNGVPYQSSLLPVISTPTPTPTSEPTPGA